MSPAVFSGVFFLITPLTCLSATELVFLLKLLYADKIKTLLDQQEELYERQAQLKALLEISKTSRDTSNSAPSVALEDWSGKFSWDSQADDTRFNVFGISSYRSNQREVSL